MSKSKSELIAGLDTFTEGYIDCALWCGIYSDSEDEIEREVELLTVKALRQMIADCKDFQEANAEDIDSHASKHGLGRSGHNFWLNRNGHGAGYQDDSDGHLPGAACRLQAAAKVYGSVDLSVYRGKIHHD